MIRNLVIAFVYCCGINSAIARNLGGPPLYSILSKNDVVVGIPAKGYSYGFSDPATFRQSISSDVVSIFPHDKMSGSISFINDLMPLPKSSTFRLVFLKGGEEGFEVVNLLCSSVPTSIHQDEFESVCKNDTPWEAVAECLNYERDAECIVRQALALAFAPPLVIQIAWKNISSKSTSDQKNNLLPYLVIGLFAEGDKSLKVLKPYFHDLSKIGLTEAGEDPFVNWLRGSVVTWVHKNATSENASALLEFALFQAGPFKGQLLIGIAKYVSKADVGKIIPLLSESDIMVQYACVKTLAYMFDDGKNIPTIDSFKASPDEYIRHMRLLLNRQ